jgi:polyferredoxin
VRYTTENALAHKYPESQIVHHIIRPRVVMYSAVLLVVVGVASWSLLTKVPLMVNITHDRNALVRETDEGLLENSYRLQIQSTDEKPHRFHIAVHGLPDMRVETDHGEVFDVPPNGSVLVAVRVEVEPQHASRGAKKFWFDVEAADDPSLKVSEKASFIGR